MQFGVLRSPMIVIVVCLAILVTMAIFVPPPPAKTMDFTGTVAAFERDPQSGAPVAVELHAGEAVLLVNMNVPAAKAAPAPFFHEGETVTLKVASPHVEKNLPDVVRCDYLADLTAAGSAGSPAGSAAGPSTSPSGNPGNNP